MPTIPDVIPAVRDYLASDTDVATLVADAVYGEELPDGIPDGAFPFAVLVRGGGGYGDAGTASLNNHRYEVRSFGPNPYDARQVFNAVYSALKNMPAHVEGDVKLLTAALVGGPIPLRDPDVRWPYVVSMWTIMAREV